MQVSEDLVLCLVVLFLVASGLAKTWLASRCPLCCGACSKEICLYLAVFDVHFGPWFARVLPLLPQPAKFEGLVEVA
jgi:hypothetical protein